VAKRKAVAKKSPRKKRKVVRGVAVRKPKSKPKLKQKPKSKPKTKQRSEPKPLKLAVDLVPQKQWYKNLRKQVPHSVWDKLRKEVYAQSDFKCQICGAEGKLNCHEIWEYEEKNLVQRLTGFHAVCSMCHHVTHFGMSSILASQGHLDIEEVIRHFMKVNGVSREAFEEHLSEATDIWQYRSQFEWVLDYGQWAALLPEKPA
jgi:hypothetical protein